MDYSIGIDLGGTNIKAVAVDSSDNILERATLSSDDNSEQQDRPWARSARELVVQLERAQQKPARFVGIAAPGLAATDLKTIAYQPGKLHGLEGFNWSDFLKRGFMVPVLNDAHAALLGEAWLGAAAGLSNVVLLTLGTGVGGAILVNGKLLSGAIGRAGHIGHMSVTGDDILSIFGMPGSLERAIGNYSVSERTGGKFSSTLQLVEAYRAGDEMAAAEWLKSINVLARALASLINILDPEAIIIGGGISRAGADLFDPLRNELEKIEWRPGGHVVKVLPASLGEWAGALGAARFAMEKSR